MIAFWRRLLVVMVLSGVMVLLTCRIYLLPTGLLDPGRPDPRIALTIGESGRTKSSVEFTTGEMAILGESTLKGKRAKPTPGLVIKMLHTSASTETVRGLSPSTDSVGGGDWTSIGDAGHQTTAATSFTTTKEASTKTATRTTLQTSTKTVPNTTLKASTTALTNSTQKVSSKTVTSATQQTSTKIPTNTTEQRTSTKAPTSTTQQASTAVTYIDSKTDKFLLTFKDECQSMKIPSDLLAKDKQCPCFPDKLVGRRLPGTYVPTWQELETAHPDMEEGGHWRPSSCVPRQRACFFLPYRDRQEHLLRWLKVMLPFMKKQNSDFRIFVTEQNNGSRFNRGMLVNAGVAHVEKEGIHCDCIIIHDVDHVPEDDRNIYFCQDKPIHLAVARNDHKYTLPYPTFVGGAMAATLAAYKRINGFSNLYFGWGSEDDDIYERFKGAGLGMKRYPTPISFYTMFKHEHAVENKGRWKLVRAWKSRWKTDGLGDVMDQCAISKVDKRKLITFLQIDVDEDSVVARSKSNAPQQDAAQSEGSNI